MTKILAAWLLSAALLLFSFSGDVRSQDHDATVVTRVRVLQHDGPVQILGIKPWDVSGPEPYVHMRNTSSSKTSRIWVEVIIGGGQGNVVRTNSNAPNQLWPAERAISPGAEAWARESVLTSSALLMAAKELRSNCISVGVLVMRVDFEDGTSWRSSASTTALGKTDKALPCGGATASEDEIGRLVSINSVRPQDSSAEVQSYSFTCSLESKEGRRIVGSCPF
jgi:hypothetical protein